MAPVYSNLAVLLIVMSNVGATQTLEEAFATGVLMAKNGGIVCACSPDKHYPATWGPQSSEWRAHQGRDKHKIWARAQRGKRKLELSGSASAPAAEQKRPLKQQAARTADASLPGPKRPRNEPKW